MRINLKRLTLLIFIFIGLVPISLTSLLIRGWEESLNEYVQDLNSQNKTVIKNSVYHHLDKMVVTASGIIRGPEIKEFFRTPSDYRIYSESLMHGYLNEIPRSMPEVKKWFLYDKDSKLILQRYPLAVSLPPPGFHQINKEIFYTRPIRLNEQDAIDKDGELVGYLTVAIQESSLLDIYGQLAGIKLNDGELSKSNLEVTLKSDEKPTNFSYQLYLALIIPALITSLLVGAFLLYVSLFKPLKSLTLKIIDEGNIDPQPYRNSNEIAFLSKAFSDYTKSIQEKYLIEAKLNISKKVAHDIKSPLTSLEYFFDVIKPGLDESLRRLGSQSLERIQDIINTLNYSTLKGDGEQKTHENIYHLVSCLIGEKRNEFSRRSNLKMTFNADSPSLKAFGFIEKAGFLRTLSNIINNSAEALNKERINIKIKMQTLDNTCFLSIEDDGKGIPEEDVEDIFEMGYSKGKVDGTGIGLWQAKEFINRNNGTIEVKSTPEKGTIFLLTLLLSEQPKWFKNDIVINKETRIAILDDDPSIHSLWNKRFSLHKNKLFHFHNSVQFEEWLIKNNSANQFCLIDLELLNDKKDGLEIIKDHSLQEKSLLVTSHFSDLKIQSECLKEKIFLMPKGLATTAEISVL